MSAEHKTILAFKEHIPHFYPDEGMVNDALPTLETSVFNNPLGKSVFGNRDLQGRIAIPNVDKEQPDLQKKAFELIVEWLRVRAGNASDRKKATRSIEHFCASDNESYQMVRKTLLFQIESFTDDDRRQVASLYEELAIELQEKFAKRNEAEPPKYFRGILRFGPHAIDDQAYVELLSEKFAEDMQNIFTLSDRNIVLVEAANLPSSASDIYRLYFKDHGSHLKAYAATVLYFNHKKINKVSVEEMVAHLWKLQDVSVNFIISLFSAMDLLKSQKYKVEVRFEDCRMKDAVQILEEYHERAKHLDSLQQFKDYFHDYIATVVTERNQQFVRVVDEIVEDSEKNKKKTNLFGFIGISHRKGIVDQLDEGTKSVIIDTEVLHAGSSMDTVPLNDLIVIALCNGRSCSEEQWNRFYAVYKNADNQFPDIPLLKA